MAYHLNNELLNCRYLPIVQKWFRKTSLLQRWKQKTFLILAVSFWLGLIFYKIAYSMSDFRLPPVLYCLLRFARFLILPFYNCLEKSNTTHQQHYAKVQWCKRDWTGNTTENDGINYLKKTGSITCNELGNCYFGAACIEVESGCLHYWFHTFHKESGAVNKF